MTMVNPIDRLALGTAQFGMQYGVANASGQPDVGRVAEIMAAAYAEGFRMLDTAAAYGESEQVLGRCGVGDWSVVTKFPSLVELGDDQVADAVRQSVLTSLERLRILKLHAVLAHDSRDMCGSRGTRILVALEELRSEGLLDHVGISVYEPDAIHAADAAATEIVQAPFNILDQRMITSGAAAALAGRGGALHVRSLFLQGVLLMAPAERPAYFSAFAETLARFDALAAEYGLDRLALCLGFVTRQPLVSLCVVGAETPEQIAQIAAACSVGHAADLHLEDLHSGDPDLIDPRRWRLGA